MKRLKIVVLSGAGISAESGVSTFRDQNGLWENHDIMDVASIEGWHRNSALVLDFYNKRRAQLKTVFPNDAHKYCAFLEQTHDVTVVTQNVDDLHERAGSSHIIHLHGRLLSARSSVDDSLVYPWTEDILPGDKAGDGSQLRPDIVWFGEAVPLIGEAMDAIKQCDVLIVVGTSLQVYPAAGLVGYAHRATKIYLIDPNHVESYETIYFADKLEVLTMPASDGMARIMEDLG